MLAVLVAEPFSDPDWIFERKLDGERVLAVVGEGEVRLFARNGMDVSGSYPEVVEALSGGGEKAPMAVLDGEMVASLDSGTPFVQLQERIRIDDPEEARRSPVAVRYYLFDVLHLGGFDLKGLPLRTRKGLLRKAVSFHGPLRFLEHRTGEGEALFREARREGWEGGVAKKADSPYQVGRSRAWLKLKCAQRQDLVLCGFTEPDGRRKEFGALLVGYWEKAQEKEKQGGGAAAGAQGGGERGTEGSRGGQASGSGEGGRSGRAGRRVLRYAGKVGSGFNEDTLRRLGRLLKARRRKTPPFSRKDAGDLPKTGVHWVTPSLVGRFGFSEWTATGKLRHPRFLGLRRDKDPEEVVKEEPVAGGPWTLVKDGGEPTAPGRAGGKEDAGGEPTGSGNGGSEEDGGEGDAPPAREGSHA